MDKPLPSNPGPLSSNLGALSSDLAFLSSNLAGGSCFWRGNYRLTTEQKRPKLVGHTGGVAVRARPSDIPYSRIRNAGWGPCFSGPGAIRAELDLRARLGCLS